MTLGYVGPGSVGSLGSLGGSGISPVAFLVLLALGAVVWTGVLVLLVRVLMRRSGQRQSG